MNSVDPAKCDLCGSDVGRAAARRAIEGTERSFCCAGCANVYSILLESGAVTDGQDLRQTDLFRQSLRLGLISRPESEPASAAPPTTADNDIKESLFQLSGMWCSSCGWVIEKALTAEPGVQSAEVLFASDLLKVRYSPRHLPPGRIERRVEGLGYGCVAYSPQKPVDSAERRDLLLRVGVAAFVWTNVMYLSLVLYVGYFESVTPSARTLVPFILMTLTAAAVFYSAYPVLKAAWTGLRERTIRVETLLGLGILSAWGYSSVQAFVGGEHFYFDTACAIVTLVLTGKLIEMGARERTARAVSSLYRMMPRKARVVEDKRERYVSVETLADGTMFLVKAGETIPADGIVAEGNSHVDESVLTGESVPVVKEPGSSVACGSTNGAGVIRVRATRTGDRTTLSQIIGMVERAISTRSPLERQADRVSRIFVPVVILIAVATFTGALLLEAPGPALMRAITVLVVACPCALGIATPLAVTAGIGAASRRGILVSDPRVLETVTKLDMVIFDKTGTVTEGRFLLQDHAVSSSGERFGEDHLPIIATLERCSEHPLGRAVVEHAKATGIALSEALGVEVHEGAGITGAVGRRKVFVGSRKLRTVAENLIPAELETRAASWAGEGKTVAFYGWDGEIHGALALGDRVKPAANRVFAALRASGVRTSIVSGDTDAAVAHAAAAVGADEYRSGCTPRDKEGVIRDLQARGHVVAMVGDGVNDAPALALADLGIAMGSGTDVAMRAAPVTLMTSDLGRIPETFSLARRTVRIVRQNLFWAFFYNTAGISLAILGVLNPIAAAGAMVVSSLSVVLNSLRASRVGVRFDI